MESYIEVSLLHNVLTVWLSVYVAILMALQPIRHKQRFLYALGMGLVGCLLWGYYSWVWLMVVEGISFFFFFRYAYKTYFTALILRYMSYATMVVCYGGSFHNGVWFVPIHCPIWVVWLLYTVVYILLKVKWKDVVSQLSYVYEIVIYTKQDVLKLASYLDSGNLLTYRGVPILFVDKKYHAYFKNQRIELVVMNSVCASDVIRCYECAIQVAGCKKQQVYINADRHLILPFTCSVLLNMNVMTTG